MTSSEASSTATAPTSNNPTINQNSAKDSKQGTKPTSGPAWVNALQVNHHNDTRTQPWRSHDGICEDKNFEKEPDLVRIQDAEYPGGSLAA